jgi:hypothetical protein
MSTSEQYRAKAAEYAALKLTANNPEEVRELQRLERSFTMLADNEQWLVSNRARILHTTEQRQPENGS